MFQRHRRHGEAPAGDIAGEGNDENGGGGNARVEDVLCDAVGRIMRREGVDDGPIAEMVEEVEVRPLDDGDDDDDGDDGGRPRPRARWSSLLAWAGALLRVGAETLALWGLAILVVPEGMRALLGAYALAALALYQAYVGLYLGRYVGGGAARGGWRAHRVVLSFGRKFVKRMGAQRRLDAVVRALGPGFRYRVEAPSVGRDALTSEDDHFVLEWDPRGGAGGRWGRRCFGLLAAPWDPREDDLPRAEADPLLDALRPGAPPASPRGLARGLAAKAWRDVVAPRSAWTWAPALLAALYALELHQHWAGYARPEEGMWGVYRLIGQLALGQQYHPHLI